MLEDNCQKFDGPMSDLSPNQKDNIKMLASINQTQIKKGKRRVQAFTVLDMITCLALCHNVTPTYPDNNDRTIREY